MALQLFPVATLRSSEIAYARRVLQQPPLAFRPRQSKTTIFPFTANT